MQTEQLPFYIGRYCATARLGSGGMGVVYLAMDERLNRQVAIKKLLHNPNSNNASARIRREALLLAQLNHNNIVQLYDVVEGENGIALVMEYVDGCNLERWQREHAPNLAKKLQILKQICAGLTRAHSAGIIHRDLKAENILVDSGGTIKITDFGIAKSLQEDSDLTREQHVAGSWGAMSPEQAQGKPLDSRSDLFSFGVLAYRLLCRQNPFGDNRSPYVTVDRIVKSPHPPAAKLAPELPPPLCALLDQLLAKEPEQRPLNAVAVAAEIEQHLLAIQGGSTSFTPTHSITATVTAENFYQRSNQPRTHHLRRITKSAIAFGIVTGIVAVATLALVNSDRLLRTADPASNRYIALLEPLDGRNKSALNREQQLLVSNVRSALKQGLSNRSGLNLISFTESHSVRGEPLAAQAKSLSADLLLIPAFDCGTYSCELSLELLDSNTLAVVGSRSTRLAVVEEGPETRARTLHQVDNLMQDYPQREGDQSLHISDADYLTYLKLYERRGDQLHQGELLDQLDELQKTAGNFAPLYELYASTVIDHEANSRAGDVETRLANFLQKAPASLADAPELLISKLHLAIHSNDTDRAVTLLARLKLTLPDRASYYFLSTAYYHKRGEYPQALQEIDKALALRTSYVYLIQKAQALSQMGDMPAANQLLREALIQHPGLNDAKSLLAGNLLDMGEAKEGIRLLTEGGMENLGSLDLYNLCMGYYVEKMYPQAQGCFDRVTKLSPDDADPLLYRAEIARALGHPEQASAFIQRALEVTQGRDDWEALLLQARAYAELGDAEKAVANLIKIRRDAPDDTYVNFVRAQVYIATGNLLSAKAHIRKALEQGISPIWYCTPQFDKICSLSAFDDLRQQYPGLCADAGENQKNKENNKAGDSQIASHGDARVKL